MELVTLAPRASAEGRAAVDGVLRTAPSRWEGGGRRLMGRSGAGREAPAGAALLLALIFVLGGCADRVLTPPPPTPTTAGIPTATDGEGPPAAAPLPPPPAREYPGIAITRGGVPVPPGVAALVIGPEHCGYEHLLLLNVGWPLGHQALTDLEMRQYVRDPGGTVAKLLLAGFDGRSELPPDAVDTGFRYGNHAIWISASTVDREIFIVRAEGAVEAWPRARAALACA